MSPIKVEELRFKNHLPPVRGQWRKCKLRSPAHLANMDKTPAGGWPPHLGAGVAALHNPSALRLHAVSREGNACSRGLLLRSMERHETGEREGLGLERWPWASPVSPE